MPKPLLHPNLQAGGDTGSLLYKIGAARKPSSETDNFIGEVGDIFYSMRDTKLRISDGETAGGWYIIPDLESVERDILPREGFTVNIGGPELHFNQAFFQNIIIISITIEQRNELTAVNGMIIYNSTAQQFQVYENNQWVAMRSGGGGGSGIDYGFNIAAEDNTVRPVYSGSTIQFNGGTNITTQSDNNGNITINGPDLGAFIFNGSTITTDDSSSIIFGQTTIFQSDINIENNLTVNADVDINANLFIDADLTVNNNLTISNNLVVDQDITANTLAITNLNFNGQIINAADIGTITISELDASNQVVAGTTLNNISHLAFDQDSGFAITDIGSGIAKVAMNSTFKYWHIDGQDTIEASGLDDIELVAGNGITLESDITASPYKTLKISTPSKTVQLFQEGLLEPTFGVLRWYAPGDITMDSIVVRLATVSDVDILVTINKSGVSIDSATIPAGSTKVTKAISISFDTDDYLTVDLAMANNTTGTGLSAEIFYTFD